MKKLLLIITSLFTLIACEEVVDIDLDTDTPRLVVDGGIERTFEQKNDGTTSITDSAFLTLSLTRSFFSNTPVPVENATATITAVNTNTVFNLTHSTDGKYIIDNTTPISIDPEETYKLDVDYEGETYTSSQKLLKSTPLVSVVQIPSPVDFDEAGPALNVTFKDPAGEINYLVFDFGNGDIFSVDDEDITEGTDFTFLSILEESVKDNVTTKVIGADKDYASFVDDLVTISGDGGGPFGVTPFLVRGNIVNETNDDNYALGYFRVTEIYTRETSLVEDL